MHRHINTSWSKTMSTEFIELIDKYLKENEAMAKATLPKLTHNTAELQEESLVNFGAALGYEPVYDLRGLRCFRQPNFSVVGREHVSVNTMIRLHNESAEEVFAMLKMTPYVEFGEFIKKQSNVEDLITIFAGTTKIVQRVKLVFSKKKGLIVQDHNVKFMTKRDQRYYGF